MAIHFDTQGPAPDGFHVPLSTERQAVYDIWTALGGWGSAWTNFWIALKLPFAGYRIYSSAGVGNQGTYGDYWSSSRSNANYAYCLYFDSFDISPQSDSRRSAGYSVRCFKDTPTVPTSSWTKLYWTSIEAWWIFWSSTDWLISLSSDGSNWITIADKNLGATTVWNSGDTLSEANCGKYYQWGNNYGFPRTWTIANQSTTQVDVSNYWPRNYYSSDTFIKYSWSRDSSDNWNLWWWESQWERSDPIKLHWAIQTFHRAPHYDWYLNKATIAYYPLTEDLLDHKDNWKEPINLSVSWSGYSFGTNWFWQAWVQLTWSTYFYPWSWNVWGKHPWTDDMTIAFRVSNYSPAAYWSSWSWYHCWILSFGRQFKTWIMWDWVLGKDVGILDGGYEWFSLDPNYVWSTTENPKTLNWVTAETYLNSYLSVVDTFHNWHHTRYISNIGADTPFCENDYNSTKTVDVNYIWWDNYSSSNYRYFRWYMRDFVVSWDVWNPMMIRNYFNEDLGWNRWETITWFTYDNKSFSFSSQEQEVQWMCWKPDGTKFYLVWEWWDKVYQYSCSTAYDISTASYDNKSISINDTVPRQVRFKPDWTQMYILCKWNNSESNIYIYNLSTAWDITTATYNTSSANLPSKSYNIFLSTDWTKLYTSTDWNTFLRYQLSTAWDLTTFSTSDQTISSFPKYQNIYFNPQWTQLFGLRRSNPTYIDLYTLSTAWDITTLSSSTAINIWNWDAMALSFNDDWSKAYACWRTNPNRTMYQYSTTTA